MRLPTATCRLQLTDEFTLDAARETVPYLARLGISDLYLSPVFEARAGSAHGYDVTDSTRVRASLGGRPALERLADEAQRHEMGILLDIVPNHMAASVENPWWRDVLEHGRASQYASFFDIDWNAGAIVLPILGEEPASLIERGEIRVAHGANELHCPGHCLPLAQGSLNGLDAAQFSEPGALTELLARQHYRLVHWRSAQPLTYRRFFDVTDLVGVRVEDPAVFAATHALIRDLVSAGIVTGLRVDHIDGLRDPLQYLERLRATMRSARDEPVYTVVEKILERSERLPPSWPCEGTTGYEFMNLLTGAHIDRAGHETLEGFYRRITGGRESFVDLVRNRKLLVIDRLFASEIGSLAARFEQLTGLRKERARSAIAELTASLGVYRTYTRDNRIDATDHARIDAATRDAVHRNPELKSDIELAASVALMEHSTSSAALDWVLRWQQFTGPVTAKGFEDTALYCHNALLAANEVGSHPAEPAIDVDTLHASLAERLQQQPHGLSATSTHDTKRGEDTRARIAVLSEIPDEWRSHLRRWMRDGDQWKQEIASEEETEVPSAGAESLLYQTLVGAWPLDGHDDEFRERIKQYMTKAVREAKEQTSWRRPDEDFEEALHRYIDHLIAEYSREGLTDQIAAFAMRIARHGALNSIAQLLLRTTAPGVPDLYQGTELWSFTLVDPDNRRGVDFDERYRLLQSIDADLESSAPAHVQAWFETWRDGKAKLHATSCALRFRRRHVRVLRDGSYTPLLANGERAGNVIAFARVLHDVATITVVPRLTTQLATDDALPVGLRSWSDTTILLPAHLRGEWHNALTHETVSTADGHIRLADLFRTIPFALLEGK